MKSLFYTIVFFIIIACSTNKTVYWCGDHPCINKTEKEAYFKKTMIVEVKELKKESSKNSSEIEKIMLQAGLEEKARIKKEKKLTKYEKLVEKQRKKEEKILAKQIRRDEKKILKNEKKVVKKIVKIEDSVKKNAMASSDFDKLVEKIANRNTFRSYPDINDIPSR
jgi:uncharacterized iron-regulated protein|tara:strand:+ start:681 stop:1178 length:498 start_codon:yes stop_codon:yes gene_type:complete